MTYKEYEVIKEFPKIGRYDVAMVKMDNHDSGTRDICFRVSWENALYHKNNMFMKKEQVLKLKEYIEEYLSKTN